MGKYIKWNGEVHNAKEWANILGIKYTTLIARLNRGYSIEEAFSTVKGGHNRTHGMAKTPIWYCHSHMKGRCYNRNNKAYKWYGGRGIKVCDEWLGENGFQNFYEWAINNGYKEGLTLDRIDANGDYEPSNCRWATWEEQENNRRDNKRIKYRGKALTIPQWAKELGIPKYDLYNRKYRGLEGATIITDALRARGMI